MQNTTEKSSRSAEGLYKFFIYFVLVLLAVTIIVPVAWVFMASIKQNAEFYGNPWSLPAGFYWQNFVNAWNGAKMGEYMLNSVIVTALALALLLVVALPAAYCLSRFHFKARRLLNTLFMAGLFIWWCWRWCTPPPRCPLPSTCCRATLPPCPTILRRPPISTVQAIFPP